ncbi:DUF2922 domain-containing protein [Bacillus sp. REN16]|uniref:DUF2922 domain-containing protein n=1 Tax=Bacillus sp. REN16 TaxID=2887296 RepID=UPI001E3CA949|nr:DUF2922 domain-containing protein [Bacillus sp. REN16]MCC3356163.1 DUF2922 domain-containing protein [Bacillus sp. REN16]
MAKTLEMQFINEDGKTATVSIENPIEPVDTVALAAAMDLIVANDVFVTSGGSIVEKKGARLVERNVETVEL